MASAIRVLELLRRQPLRLLRLGTGAGALVVLIGWGIPNTLYRAGRLIADARRWASVDALEARRRTFGPAYTGAIESIRRTLPGEASYLLVPQKPSTATGWELWVRYDLAPRQPILVQSRGDRGLRGPRGTAIPRWVDRAVVADERGVPILLRRDQLLARRRSQDDRR